MIYVRAVGVPEHGRVFGPASATGVAAALPCLACWRQIGEGEYTTLIALGPGDSGEARERARDGRPYNSVAVEVHLSCATGVESS